MLRKTLSRLSDINSKLDKHPHRNGAFFALIVFQVSIVIFGSTSDLTNLSDEVVGLTFVAWFWGILTWVIIIAVALCQDGED